MLHELPGYSRVRNYDGSWTEWGSMVLRDGSLVLDVGAGTGALAGTLRSAAPGAKVARA